MTLPGFPPYAETKEATRKARAFLSATVRNDWSFPESDSNEPPNDYASRGEVAWTQRRYSSGDETLEAEPTSPVSTKSEAAGRRRSSTTQRSITRSKRQARLRRELGEECTTNPGLAHFCARRDAWTSAKIMNPPDADSGATPHTSSSSATLPVTASHPPPAACDDNDHSPTRPPHPEEQDHITLLPIPQPILQEHPLRSRVDKSAYGEIYSKVILQGRTPSIPINLAHVTRSLVHGWKEEGNWPPKETVAEQSLAKKKSPKETEAHATRNPLRKGVHAVGRAFRLG